MKKLTIKKWLTAVDDVGIAAFETDNNIVFPDFFKDFLKEYNGSKVVENQFNGQYMVSNFLSLYKGKNASIELILPAVRSEEEGIGRGDLIPFAVDPGGRPYYLSIGASDYSNVFFDRTGLGHENPLLKIADSFEQFIDGLNPEPID